MYLLIDERHEILMKCYGNYIKVKRFYFLLDIVAFLEIVFCQCETPEAVTSDTQAV